MATQACFRGRPRSVHVLTKRLGALILRRSRRPFDAMPHPTGKLFLVAWAALIVAVPLRAQALSPVRLGALTCEHLSIRSAWACGSPAFPGSSCPTVPAKSRPPGRSGRLRRAPPSRRTGPTGGTRARWPPISRCSFHGAARLSAPAPRFSGRSEFGTRMACPRHGANRPPSNSACSTQRPSGKVNGSRPICPAMMSRRPRWPRRIGSMPAPPPTRLPRSGSRWICRQTRSFAARRLISPPTVSSRSM